jgi:hypothetical protein
MGHWLWKYRQYILLVPIIIVGFLLARHFPKLDPTVAFVTPIILAVLLNFLIYMASGVDIIGWYSKRKAASVKLPNKHKEEL